MAQKPPLIMVKGGRTSRGCTGSARLVTPAWTQSRPPAQPVAAVDVSVSQVDSSVDLSVPINFVNNDQPPTASINQSSGNFVGSTENPRVPVNLADLDGVGYPTNIDFPDCLTIDINFKSHFYIPT